MKKQIISEEFKRMQKLAGLITETQANKMLEKIGMITHKTLQDYVLLIRDVENDDTMNPSLKMVFTSNDESNLDIPKGQLADLIQNELGEEISTEDFDIEGPMSYDEFKNNYKMTIPAKLIYGINDTI
jgi:hypothetical protein